MPNNISNKLTITADSATVDDIIETLTTIKPHPIEDYREVDFNRIIPEPPGASLNWRRGYWGSSWNAYETMIQKGEGGVIIKFETGWTPPFPVISRFASLFPGINFTHKYYCEMHNFWGVNTWRYSSGDQATILWKQEESPKDRQIALLQELLNYSDDDIADFLDARAHYAVSGNNSRD